MKQISKVKLLLLLIAISVFSIRTQAQKLWYSQPAKIWTEALPIGNGRMAAMVYGGTEKETIQLNEETVWTGQPHDYAHKGAFQYLDSIRGLLFAGNQKDAHRMADKQFMSQPYGQQCYQPLGNILLSFPGHEKAEHFYRDLTLNNALASVSYQVDGVTFTREIFASFPDNAIFVKITASKSKALNFKVEMTCPHYNKTIIAADNQLVLKGNANNYPYDYYEKKGNFKYPTSKINFESRLQVQNTDGTLEVNNNAIEVKNASSVVLKLVAATNFVNYNDISANAAERCDKYQKAITELKYEKAKKKSYC